MAFKDKAWKDLDTAIGYARYFHGARIYKTSAGFVTLPLHERKKFKSWKLVKTIPSKR